MSSKKPVPVFHGEFKPLTPEVSLSPEEREALRRENEAWGFDSVEDDDFFKSDGEFFEETHTERFWSWSFKRRIPFTKEWLTVDITIKYPDWW